jgi:hypothetical protein
MDEDWLAAIEASKNTPDEEWKAALERATPKVTPLPDVAGAAAKAVGGALRGADTLITETLPKEAHAPYQTAKTGLGRIAELTGRPWEAAKAAVMSAKTNENPLAAAKAGLMGERKTPVSEFLESDDSWQKALSMIDPESARNVTKAVGGALEFADPTLGVTTFGLSKAGKAAALAGELEPGLTRGAEMGQRALLSVGGVPLVEGKPVLKAAGAVQDTLRKQFPGFHTKTGLGPMDRIIDEFENKKNLATIQANERAMADKATLDLAAKEASLEPGALRTQMGEAIEPSGSQALEGFGPEELLSVQQKNLEGLPKGARELTEKYIGENKKFHAEESALKDFGNREFYQLHTRTPEYKEFLKKTFGDEDGPVFKGAGKNPSEKARADKFDEYTVNEINNLSFKGELNKAYGGKFPEADKFRGKVFSDETEAVAAERFLRNQKVLAQKDFDDAVQRTYGMDKKAFHSARESGAIGPQDYFEHKGVMYPKPVADYLNKMETIRTSPAFSNALTNSWKATMDFIRMGYYNLWPKGAVDNAVGGPFLAALNDLYDPVSHVQGWQLAKILNDPMKSNLANQVVLRHPKLGDMTAKQVVELAKQHRATSVGLARSELQTVQYGKGLSETKLGKTMMGAQDFSEAANRLGAFVHSLKKGYMPDAGASATRKAFHDYHDMSQVDKSIKRFVPFFSFARKNVPAMMKMTVKRPAMVALPEKARQQFQDEQEKKDETMMYTTLRDQMPVKVADGKDGQPIYFFMGRYLPQNALNQYLSSGEDWKEQVLNSGAKTLESLFGLTSPMVKAIPEAAFNYSMQRHGPISKQKGEKTLLLPNLPPLPAKLTYFLQQVPILGQMSYGSKHGKTPALAAVASTLGPKFQPFDRDQAELSFKKGQKFGLREMADKVRFYSKQAALRRQKGDTAGERESLQNRQTAIENYREEVKRTRGRLKAVAP